MSSDEIQQFRLKTDSMTGFAAQVAAAAGVERKHAEAILRALKDVLITTLPADGKARIPGLLVGKVVVKPDKKACKKMIFGKAVELPYKPSTKVVRLVPLKNVRTLQ